MGAVMQPMPAVQVELDKQGTLVVKAAANLSRQQWQAMAKAAGWSEGAASGIIKLITAADHGLLKGKLQNHRLRPCRHCLRVSLHFLCKG